jgi:hypothetical protein
MQPQRQREVEAARAFIASNATGPLSSCDQVKAKHYS